VCSLTNIHAYFHMYAQHIECRVCTHENLEPLTCTRIRPSHFREGTLMCSHVLYYLYLTSVNIRHSNRLFVLSFHISNYQWISPYSICHLNLACIDYCSLLVFSNVMDIYSSIKSFLQPGLEAQKIEKYCISHSLDHLAFGFALFQQGKNVIWA